MDLKSEKALFGRDEPSLPEVASAHTRPRPARFRNFLARHSLGVYNNVKAWKPSCASRKKYFDIYAKHIEDSFLAVPSTESAITNSRHYGTHPHLAGAPEDLQDAKDILSVFQEEFGISGSSAVPIFEAGSTESREATLTTTSKLNKPNAWIDVYYPVMNTGNADGITLELLGSDGESVWTADLLEDGDPGDETAAKYKHAIPPFHGFSASGEAIGQLVYANYGTKDDYDKLTASGVDLTGKIVLARYGANCRGLKVQGAEERGAAGILIYTDPRDDGAVVEANGYATYPYGPARNPTSIQRGSVQYLSTYPGDPTTPGYPAYENATRVEGGNVPSIPSLPLSWANAAFLILDGTVGTRLVKMVNDVDTKVTPIWNTMAAIPGHVRDEVVILGCHRDAWVMGAADPTSGTVSLIELVRGLGALVRQGWKPLRTIVIASWDAEEYGLIGSTEWGEDFADWIQAHAVSYINVDVSVSGSQYGASGSPSLAHLIKRSAQDVPHPTDPSRTVWDALYDSGPYTGEQDEEFAIMWAAKNGSRARVASEDDVRHVSPLGSGSDYTVFLQRLGVASSDQSFGNTPTDAPYHYHSIYDSQMWQETYADPGFHRHVALAKSLGLLALRLADSIILPLNTTQYALELDSYVDIVEESAVGLTTLPKLGKLRKAISELQHASLKLDVEKFKAEKAFLKALHKITRRRVVRGIVHRVKDWIKRHMGTDSSASEPNGADMQAALNMLRDIVPVEACKSYKKSAICDLTRAASRVKMVNQKLAQFERGFISEEGVKDREWYRHLGVAPGKYLGYGATTLPALTEAVLYEEDPKLA
ncbi:Zn-dependent exopeptidase, partial [Melanogaster broomeanus]